MGDEICVGRKEIIEFFREIKLVSQNISTHAAWNRICELRRRYELQEYFHTHPNGKPKIFKMEVLGWLEKHDKNSKVENNK